MTDTAPGRKILVCFDGSDHAKQAIRETARLFPNAHVDVVSVRKLDWTQPLSGDPAWPLVSGTVTPEVQLLASDTRTVAEQGAGLARDLGLDAYPDGIVTSTSVWREIVAMAFEGSYDLVVVGSRGRSGVKTAVLGSVSSGISSHSRVPVLVVHDPKSPALDDDRMPESARVQVPSA